MGTNYLIKFKSKWGPCHWKKKIWRCRLQMSGHFSASMCHYIGYILMKHFWLRGSYLVFQKSTPANLMISLWPSDAIWRHGSGWKLIQAWPAAFQASSHCPSQRQLIISGVLQHSPVGDFTGNAPGIYSWNIFDNCYLRPRPHFPGTNEFRSFGQEIAHHIKQVCVYNNYPTH